MLSCVLLENIHVDSRGRNTDGIVIDSSAESSRRNSIVSGDDGISIKSAGTRRAGSWGADASWTT